MLMIDVVPSVVAGGDSWRSFTVAVPVSSTQLVREPGALLGGSWLGLRTLWSVAGAGRREG
jgi:hypothetical protein